MNSTQTEGRERYTYKLSDVEAAFLNVGVSQGDVVFLTAGIGNLGVLQGSESIESTFAALVGVLQELVGAKGALLVPTYSYSFGTGKELAPGELPFYSVLDTPTQLGRFNEWFRMEVADERTIDPMVSLAIWGEGGAGLARNLPRTSYGHDSIFERLLSVPATVLNVGLGPRWTPFIHYVDFLCDVPHRYAKQFVGNIDDGSGAETVEWTYHVPIRIPNARGLGESNGQAAFEAGLWAKAPLGRARVVMASYSSYFDFTLERTRADSWNLALGPAVDVSDATRN